MKRATRFTRQYSKKEVIYNMVRIGHAVCDENGKVDGKLLGDQTGKEIRLDNWYISGNGWDYLLVCTDKVLAQKAADICAEICRNSNYGYSQIRRWSGYNSIEENGLRYGKGDFDCSSLDLACYKLAGLNIKPEGYTGDMRKRLLDTGKFKAYSAKKYLASDAYAEVGALYLREGHHVCMALENGANKKPESSTIYFEKYYGKTTSIVDALMVIDAKSSFAYRVKIAKANGIKAYIGTAKQNTQLLDLLKAGKLIKP